MQRTFLVTLVCFSLIGCLTEKTAVPPGVESILAQYLTSSGGETVIKDIHTRTIVGTWIDSRRSSEPPRTAPFTIQAHSDGRWRFDSAYEVYGVDDKGGWWMEKGILRPDTGLITSKLGFVSVPGTVLALDQHFKDLRFGRKGKVDGIPVNGLFTSGDTSYTSLWFDAANGQLLRIGHYYSLLDYRQVDGIQFPHLIEESFKGGTVTLRIDEIIHNRTIPDSLLNRPGHLPTSDPG